LYYPWGVSYSSSIPSAGTVTSGGKIWKIPTLNEGDDENIQITVSIDDMALFLDGTMSIKAVTVVVPGEVVITNNFALKAV